MQYSEISFITIWPEGPPSDTHFWVPPSSKTVRVRPVYWPTAQPMVGIDRSLRALFVALYVRINMSHQDQKSVAFMAARLLNSF